MAMYQYSIELGMPGGVSILKTNDGVFCISKPNGRFKFTELSDDELNYWFSSFNLLAPNIETTARQEIADAFISEHKRRFRNYQSGGEAMIDSVEKNFFNPQRPNFGSFIASRSPNFTGFETPYRAPNLIAEPRFSSRDFTQPELANQLVENDLKLKNLENKYRLMRHIVEATNITEEKHEANLGYVTIIFLNDKVQVKSKYKSEDYPSLDMAIAAIIRDWW